MKRKIDLFRLIKSMSKSEKRYFTLDAQKAGKKNAKYLQLFKAINSLEAYSEAEIKKNFPKNLAADKTYLYDAILRSMRDYHSKKSRAAQIKEHLMDAKYLYERELYDLCEVALQNAKKLAEELGDHLSLLMINKEERKLIRATKQKGYPKKLEGLLEEKEEDLAATREEYKYLDLYDSIWKNSVRNIQIDEKDREKFTKEVSQILERKQDEFKSILAEHRFYQSSGFFYQMLGEYDKVFSYYYRAMKWWDENPDYKEEAFYNYVIDVSNFLAGCFRQERFEDFTGLIERLEKEQPSNTHHQKILFQRLFQFKLVYSINFGITKEVLDISAQVDEGLSKFSISPSTQKVLILNTAILLFIAEEFVLCNEWADKLIKNTKSQIRPDIDRGTYFIKLISSYETDNFEVFENTVRSASRFFNKDNDQYQTYYLQFLSKIKRLPDVPLDSLKIVLSELKDYIDIMRTEIEGRVPLVGVDEMTIWWIDSKLQKKSIAKIVRAERN